MDFLIFHWSARLSFPQSFCFFLPALTLFFLIMVHCMTLTHLLAFLTLYLLKISLRCGTFHCFTDEVSISISSLEVRKLNHWKESRSQKFQGLDPQNLVASLTLLFLWQLLISARYIDQVRPFVFIATAAESACCLWADVKTGCVEASGGEATSAWWWRWGILEDHVTMPHQAKLSPGQAYAARCHLLFPSSAFLW